MVDAKADTKEGIYDFVKEAMNVAVFVDCENVDPYAFAATLLNLDADNIAKIANKAPKEQVALDKFLKTCAKFKVGSVAANMGISCLFLGLILPYSMMKYRANQQNGNKDFHVQAEIEKQLEMNFKGRVP